MTFASYGPCRDCQHRWDEHHRFSGCSCGCPRWVKPQRVTLTDVRRSVHVGDRFRIHLARFQVPRFDVDVEVTAVDRNGFWIRALDGTPAEKLAGTLCAGWRPRENDAKQHWPKATFAAIRSVDDFELVGVPYQRLEAAVAPSTLGGTE